MQQKHTIQRLAERILEGDNDITTTEYIDVLKVADHMYTNEENSFLEDNEYDAIRNIAYKLAPAHVYFTGVGSDVRGGKVKLPFEMGSLDQIEIGDICDWIGNWSLQTEEIIVTDKMDGTSALIIYDDNGDPQIAYSRGNGTEGADISRHIFKIKNVPKKVSGRMVVRAEVEMTETAFGKLREKITRHSSKNKYKNARNMVAGLMNRKENPDIVYDYLTVIAYEVVGADDISKRLQLQQLEKNRFQTVYWKMFTGKQLSDHMLAEYLNNRRSKIDYAIDGVVIDVNSKEKRNKMNPTRDTLNPAYSVKYKVADADNMAVAKVVGVTWNVSKHGYLKPQINIEPVELVGVTISNCTGFNAKFIYENGIGPGAKIQLTRSGDVIPFCQRVIEKAIPQMPGSMNADEQDWDWNETGVDAILKNYEENAEVQINQLIDFFEKIEAPYLKEGNIRKLYDTGFVQPGHIIRDLTKRQAISILGENGKKIFDGIKEKLTNIPAYKLMGAFSTERGLGVRKFKKLQKALGLNNLVNGQFTMKDILAVEGFEVKSSAKVILVSGEFGEFLNHIDGFYSFEQEKDTSGGSLTGEKICMTGFRDKDMAAAIETAGGEVQSGVSGKTTLLVCKDPNSNSGKVKKAKEKGIKVISIDEMRRML